MLRQARFWVPIGLLICCAICLTAMALHTKDENVTKPESVRLTTLRKAVSGYGSVDGRYQEEVIEVASTIPPKLGAALKGVEFINGCHPWMTRKLNDCPYGTYDPAGWSDDDSYGHDWSNSIWISSQAVENKKTADVILHEIGHAATENLFDECYFPLQAEKSVKELLLQSFASHEAQASDLLADAFVIAFATHTQDLHTHYFETFNFKASKEIISKVRAAVWLCSL